MRQNYAQFRIPAGTFLNDDDSEGNTDMQGDAAELDAPVRDDNLLRESATDSTSGMFARIKNYELTLNSRFQVYPPQIPNWNEKNQCLSKNTK